VSKISQETVHAAYDVAKKLHNGELTGPQGLDILERKYGFNRNSAETYIHNYECMNRGQRITRTLNAYATQYYLTKFLEDGGQAALSQALSALGQHIKYYEEKRNTKLLSIRKIYDHFHGLNLAVELEIVIRKGAGFGDPETNKKVELAAIEHVTNFYVSEGWHVESVEPLKCGFDLLCTKDRKENHVEVKGVQGAIVSFIITRGEKRQAEDDPDFVLCVVTSALADERKLLSYTPNEILSVFKFEALAYQATLIN
jgi:uncharacterized protein DUF3883